MPDLPENRSQWQREAKKLGVNEKGISELLCNDIQSASKIVDTQYYALRVLWSDGPYQTEYAKLGLGLTSESIEEALAFLGRKGSETPWQEYLNDIMPSTERTSRGENETVRNGANIGSFSVARYSQMRAKDSYTYDGGAVEQDSQEPLFSPRATRSKTTTLQQTNESTTPSRPSRGITKGMESLNLWGEASPYVGSSSKKKEAFLPPTPITPASGPQYSPAEDEQIVNTALLIFLQSLIMHHKDLCFSAKGSPEWTLKRLKLDFSTQGPGKDWEARTDGLLRIAGRTKALVEVKPYVREDNKATIQKQESAQMAAWICAEPNDGIIEVDKNNKKVERRLLVSQDSFEIYLNVAEFGEEYREYLHGERSAAESPHFMRITQYGPYVTTQRPHMGYLGPILLAFTLQQCRRERNRSQWAIKASGK